VDEDKEIKQELQNTDKDDYKLEWFKWYKSILSYTTKKMGFKSEKSCPEKGPDGFFWTV
jgi:hypothetical protein